MRSLILSHYQLYQVLPFSLESLREQADLQRVHADPHLRLVHAAGLQLGGQLSAPAVSRVLQPLRRF